MSIYSEFISMMTSGGFLMWVIFITAFSAFSLIIWQAIELHFKTKITRLDYAQLFNAHEHNPEQYPGQYFTKNHKSPITDIVKQISLLKPRTKTETGKIISTQLAETIPELAGSLPTVSIIGSLLPMLGLLGTVTGMINVFEVIAIHGSGKPEAMAEGISQALLTTASGLICAIPIIFLHHVLVRKVDELIVILGKAAQILQHNAIDCDQGK